ncbi:hypothetical protein BX600DRAFT_90412 [Xylariales sp. PMI_506]|nr:hypothetical protein BX600DRAFT_90412 [Xylariales sp. PMI_506]
MRYPSSMRLVGREENPSLPKMALSLPGALASIPLPPLTMLFTALQDPPNHSQQNAPQVSAAHCSPPFPGTSDGRRSPLLAGIPSLVNASKRSMLPRLRFFFPHHHSWRRGRVMT